MNRDFYLTMIVKNKNNTFQTYIFAKKLILKSQLFLKMKSQLFLAMIIISLGFNGCSKCKKIEGEIISNGVFQGKIYSFQFVPTNNASISYIYWDLGNGHTLSHQYSTDIVNAEYTSNGTYEVTAIVYSACGEIGSFKKTIVVSGLNDNDGGGTTTNPTGFRLNKFVLKHYPLTEANGENWDFFDAGPDIYFKIFQGNTVVFTSNVKNDVSESSLPLTWDISGVYLDAYSSFDIKFYDQDGALDPDDYMGGVSGFTPSNYGFSQTVYDWYSVSDWKGSWYYTWIY